MRPCSRPSGGPGTNEVAVRRDGTGGGGLDHAQFRGTRDFGALDGMRGLAAALTVAVHGGAQSSQLLLAFDPSCGVPVFFVLSGFLITTLAVREEALLGSLDMRAFYVRRALRLFPLYYLMLGVYVAIVFASSSPDALARRASMLNRLPMFLAYLNEYATFVGPPSTVFGHTWSLGIEEKFYLFWPLIGFVVLARRPGARFAASLGLYACFACLQLTVANELAFGISYAALLAGCILALLLHHARTFAWLAWLGRRGPHVLVLVAMLVYQTTPSLFEARRTLLYAWAIAAVLAALVLRPGARASRLLASRPLRYLGRRSYAVYLVHVLIVHAVDRLPILAGADEPLPTGRYFVVLGLALAVAEPLRRFVEEPGIRLGRRLSEALQERRANVDGLQLAEAADNSVRL